MTRTPGFWVTLGVASYTIAHSTALNGVQMASLYGPGGAGEGALAKLPGHLRPDYQDYGYTSRVTAEAAAAWLNEHANGGQ